MLGSKERHRPKSDHQGRRVEVANIEGIGVGSARGLLVGGYNLATAYSCHNGNGTVAGLAATASER